MMIKIFHDLSQVIQKSIYYLLIPFTDLRKDELKFTCCYHEAGFILKSDLNEIENQAVIPPLGQI